MSWLGTIVAAIITAGVGLVASGFVANLSVRWYRISSFEGGSGYYVVSLALAGLLAGFIIGLIVSRVVAASAVPSFGKGLALSLLTLVVIVCSVGGIARLLADVPPTFEGEQLMLMVEARWPSTQTESPANIPGISFVELGSINASHVQRLAKRGALWKEDAHRVDGRWTVTGAVPLFTERGTPSLRIALNEQDTNGFLLRLPAHPDRKDFEWTEWYPKEGKNGATRTSGVNYRYRVQKMSAPVRTETIGAFEIRTIVSYFDTQAVRGTTTLDAWASFDIVYHGSRSDQAANTTSTANPEPLHTSMVALLPGEKTVLMVVMTPRDSNTICALLIDDNGSLRQQRITDCSNTIDAQEITSDNMQFSAARTPHIPRGRVDRLTYASSHHLLFYQTVLDIAALSVHPFTATSSSSVITSVPPLALSPDGHSFVRFNMTNGMDSQPLLVVTDFVRNSYEELPIDASRMRFGDPGDLDPAWLMHHFAWKRNADGVDHLVARSDLVPIAYHGVFRVDDDGAQSYKIPHGGQAIRIALVEMLEKEFHATRVPSPNDAYQYTMHAEGQEFTVATTGANDYVLVSYGFGERPTTDLILRISKAFNGRLASGEYDADFIKK